MGGGEGGTYCRRCGEVVWGSWNDQDDVCGVRLVDRVSTDVFLK